MMGHWENMSAFFQMGGYASTVFGCYGLVLGCVAYTAWRTRRRYQRVLARLQQRAENPECQ